MARRVALVFGSLPKYILYSCIYYIYCTGPVTLARVDKGVIVCKEIEKLIAPKLDFLAIVLFFVPPKELCKSIVVECIIVPSIHLYTFSPSGRINHYHGLRILRIIRMFNGTNVELLSMFRTQTLSLFEWPKKSQKKKFLCQKK